MCYDSYPVHRHNQYIVDNSYLSALHELHLALMSHRVYRKGDTSSLVTMSFLCHKADVKLNPLYVGGIGGDDVTCDTLLGAWVYPRPLLGQGSQVGV